jgi:hypothetical protein
MKGASKSVTGSVSGIDGSHGSLCASAAMIAAGSKQSNGELKECTALG